MTRTCRTASVLEVALQAIPSTRSSLPDPEPVALWLAGRTLLAQLPPEARARFLPGGGLWVWLPAEVAEAPEHLARRLQGTLDLGDARVEVRVRLRGPGHPPWGAARGGTRRGRLLPLLHALERRDGYSAGHSLRVALLAVAFARWLGWPEAALQAVQEAALLHDLGKLRVPRRVLTKPGPLSPAERSLVHRHPSWGARLARALGAPPAVVEAVLAHHERWDGAGYPHGRPGADTSELARLLAVVDAFDAMTSLRPYAVPRLPDEAAAEVERGAGGQFDPHLAAAFVRFARTVPEHLPALLLHRARWPVPYAGVPPR